VEPGEERRFERLSPFELKDMLVRLAARRSERMMLNAGRGNPNWLALAPRHGFMQLLRFALEESGRVMFAPGMGGLVRGDLTQRFADFSARNEKEAGIDFLCRGLDYAVSELDLERSRLLRELVEAALGCRYPWPDRMLQGCERIVHALLERELFGNDAAAGRFDLFAVEGATAGITYIFNSLAEARLLNKGDRIALGVPIFSPYLEVPRLNDYELTEIEVSQDETRGWQYPAQEIDKLRDPSIRAFFVVNPSNPTSVRIDDESLERIARLVRDERPDLVIITDDVYATFARGFRSLAAVAPRNTILVYSFSKYWGTTGWRLGVVGMHEDSALDQRLREMPEAVREAHRRRYGSIALDPASLKLIDRMVADSRAVGLNHTAGLSTPQQAQMALFALHGLLDSDHAYRDTARGVVKRRFEALYAAAGLAVPDDGHEVYYYATLDMPALARERYGEAFARWLIDTFEPIDFVVRLAEEKSIVLLDGGGFDAPKMSVRVSLANLMEADYARIGSEISRLLADYHGRWRAASRAVTPTPP
jgi:aspartate 4-decarboxylase